MKKSVRYLMFLVGTFYFLQATGGNPGFHDQSLTKFLKEVLGFSPAQTAAFSATLIIPWMIKPIYGLISDYLPIFGYRRKSYFVLAGLLAIGSYWWLAHSDLSELTLKFWLIAAAVGFAFSDVLCDAVMVEQGQPLQATDQLQSVQWTIFGIAGIIIALSNGYIAEYLSLPQALYISAVAPTLMIFVALFALKEDRISFSGASRKQTHGGAKAALRSKSLWGVAIFLFLFNMSPNLGKVLYYYETNVLLFSDVRVGHINTVASIGFVVGAALFSVITKRKLLSHEMLIRGIIMCGVISTLAYLFFEGFMSAAIVAALASLVGAFSFLGPMSIAAKVCPKHAEGTVFAALMAVSNAGTQTGSIMGGKLYEYIGHSRGYPRAYSWLVVISAVATACMWFFLRLVREKKTV